MLKYLFPPRYNIVLNTYKYDMDVSGSNVLVIGGMQRASYQFEEMTGEVGQSGNVLLSDDNLLRQYVTFSSISSSFVNFSNANVYVRPIYVTMKKAINDCDFLQNRSGTALDLFRTIGNGWKRDYGNTDDLEMKEGVENVNGKYLTYITYPSGIQWNSATFRFVANGS